jgi:hypothetical protein
VKFIRLAILVVFFTGAGPYVWAPLYTFPEPRPFRGQKVWNPYQSSHGVWQKANLHAHALGLTRSFPDGRQTPDELARWYHEHGYSIAASSNHQHLAPQPWPIYEHGYNLFKRHILVLGATRVTWFDVPFWQSLSQKQYIVNRLHDSAEVVVLAHPSEQRAYSRADLRALTGYELLEVVNGKSLATAAWDAALSSGRLVWGMGADDAHDVADERRIGSGWTMMEADPADFSSILAALRAGHTYAVEGQGGRTDIEVQSLTVRENVIRVALRGGLASVTFSGQHGRVLKTVNGVASADYALTASDAYVRTTVRSDGSVLYLNPVIRYDGVALPVVQATIDRTGTWLLRTAFAGACAAIWLLIQPRGAAR